LIILFVWTQAAIGSAGQATVASSKENMQESLELPVSRGHDMPMLVAAGEVAEAMRLHEKRRGD
jgi:hypothetical protein